MFNARHIILVMIDPSDSTILEFDLMILTFVFAFLVLEKGSKMDGAKGAYYAQIQVFLGVLWDLAPNLNMLSDAMNYGENIRNVDRVRTDLIVAILNGKKETTFCEDRLLAAYYIFPEREAPITLEHAWKSLAAKIAVDASIPVARALCPLTKRMSSLVRWRVTIGLAGYIFGVGESHGLDFVKTLRSLIHVTLLITSDYLIVFRQSHATLSTMALAYLISSTLTILTEPWIRGEFATTSKNFTRPVPSDAMLGFCFVERKEQNAAPYTILFLVLLQRELAEKHFSLVSFGSRIYAITDKRILCAVAATTVT
ncbi:hypothetical protein HDV00_002751 [Rhizophlyctis rosea]|nr:hypothetical protein HDV00_002751 [Rhizophlyctis rosea]